MTPPKTLFDLAGAKPQAACWPQAALLLIDHQLEYDVGGGLELPDILTAKSELARLLATARAKNAPIIHIAHHGRAGGGLFDPNGPKSGFMAEALPSDGETVIVKGMPNAFAKTNLHDVLLKIGRKDLIVAGFMTHMCVSTTVRACSEIGYLPTVVAAACASRDLPDPCGGAIPADVVHQVALAELSDRFAVVVKTAQEIGD
ncbi:Isochorismatase [Rhodospirillaceae bacterium LM-1]|nr:Isochorismatase [Rhodospirillaceae bacterium LM-1]